MFYMNKRPAAVIFDMDGLLFDSEALYRDAIIAAANELGHPFTAEDFLKLIGHPWVVNCVTLQEHIGPDGDLEAFRTAWMRRYEGMKANLLLKTGSADTRSAGRVEAASSNLHFVQSHRCRAQSQSTRLVGRFDAVVASGDYDRGKPFPDPFLRAAAAAGMRTIMVPDLLPATEDIRRLCVLVAHDLHEVCAYLGDDA